MPSPRPSPKPSPRPSPRPSPKPSPKPSPSPALLEVAHVSCQYGAHAAVAEASFALRPGMLACLLGPSGCGKTTMLRAIAGFQKLDAGHIHLNGRCISDVRGTVPPEHRGLSMVFQEHALFPHLNVEKNIAAGLHARPRAERRNIIAAMLERVGLGDLRRRYPHELSGGQQQRVALARALAPSPRLLLMDEPFSNLDFDLREKLRQEVRALLKDIGATCLLVTHDLQDAFTFGERVGVMNNGAIEQWDTAYRLYHQPATRFVADFIGEGVFLDGVVTASRPMAATATAGVGISAETEAESDLDAESGVETGAESEAKTTAAIDTEIATELSTLRGTLTHRYAPGAAVKVLIRPDDILHDDHSRRVARIKKRAFRGENYLYTLALPSGAEILSLVPSHHNHAVGENLGITLDIDHLVAFPA